jgi:hypothetical protein
MQKNNIATASSFEHYTYFRLTAKGTELTEVSSKSSLQIIILKYFDKKYGYFATRRLLYRVLFHVVAQNKNRSSI